MIKLDDLLCSEADKKQVIERLDAYGIAVINDFIGAEEVNLLRQEYEKCLSGEIEGFPNSDYSIGKLTILKNDQKTLAKFPKIFHFFNSEYFRKISQSYLNGDNIMHNHEIYVCKDVKGSIHRSQILHYDRIPTLKYFIYLNDISEINGAFHCVPGSHHETRKKEKRNRSKRVAPSWTSSRSHTKKNLSKEISVNGKAGTLIIVHTDVCHRAFPIVEGERLLMRGHTRLTEDLEVPLSPPNSTFYLKLRNSISRIVKNA